MSDKIKLAMIDGHNLLVYNIMAEISSEEKSIVQHPDIGTVKDGCKRYFADECRRMLTEIISDYYSVDNLDKIKEYVSVLHARLDSEYDYESLPLSERTTEMIAKNWATHSVLRKLNYMIKICDDAVNTTEE